MKQLQHFPFVRAWWIATSNAFAQARRRYFLFAIGVGLVAAATVLLVLRRFADHRLQWVGEYEAWVAILAAVHAAILISNRRRLWTRELTQSWLAPTQRGASTLKLSVLLRTTWAPVLQIPLAIVVLVILAAMHTMTLQLAGRLMLLIASGGLFGGAVGWALGRTYDAPLRLSARFTQAALRPRTKFIRARFAALSHWPISQVLFWSSPKALRWPFILAAMSVPLGASAGLGLMIIGSWALVLYMITTLVATMRSAREAGHWLYPTPMRFSPFALALLGRTFVHQFIAGSILMAILVFSDDHSDTPEATARIFLIWIVMATTASVIAVAEGFRMADSGILIAIALFGLLAILSLAPSLFGPTALAWMAFSCWRGARRV